MADQPEDHFEPRDTLANTANTALKLTVVGVIFAGVQNTLRKQNVGAMGILTKSGGIIALYGGVGVAYQFTKDATANLRQKEDGYGEALAGFAGGAAVGAARRSFPFMLGAGVCFGTAMAAFRFTNGLTGYKKPDDDEEVERKEELRKMRRRPLMETVEQLGEGRGIYAPGYEERRRQRLLAKYGIDVNEAPHRVHKTNSDSASM